MGRDSCYGKFDNVPAHRYAYEAHRGPIPEGQMVRHLCGNKLCVNPAHLETGTAKQNFADRYTLGEGLGGCAGQGADNFKAKLSDDEARYIIQNPDGLRGCDLARKFAVSKATVTLIQQGKRWAHLQETAA